MQSVEIAFASNQAPDIWTVDTGNVPTWVKRGYLESFDEYITPEMKENFKNVLIEEEIVSAEKSIRCRISASSGD